MHIYIERDLQLIYSIIIQLSLVYNCQVLVWFHLYIYSKTHEFYSSYVILSSILFLCKNNENVKENIKEISTFSQTKYYFNNL